MIFWPVTEVGWLLQLMSRRADYLSGSHFIAIRVHGGQDVDACVMYQPHDAVVTSPVLLAEELGELNEQLTPEHFVAVHVAHVLKLRLHCRGNRVEEVTKSDRAARRDI